MDREQIEAVGVLALFALGVVLALSADAWVGLAVMAVSILLARIQHVRGLKAKAAAGIEASQPRESVGATS